MTQRIPEYLKLHIEQPPDSDRLAPSDYPGWQKLAESFQQLTGWSLRFVRSVADAPQLARLAFPLDGRSDSPAGGLMLQRPDRKQTEGAVAARTKDVEALASSIRDLLAELERSRHALWQREAELAAGVPVVPRADEAEHLAARLEAILKGAVEALGCQAAGLYLLDASTSHLKLRAAWGLPKQRLLEAPRPLRGAVADLEALIGHAVVIEDTRVLPHWKVPEDYPAAVCVPVSTPSMPLGTLWLFAGELRDFSPEQTNVLEIIAGRLATELEREMLVRHSVDSKQFEQGLAEAADWQQQRLPNVAPLLDDWQVAGWCERGGLLGNSFYDWNVLSDGRLALAVGDAYGRSVESALSAAALHSAVNAHAEYPHDARQMLQRVSETLWSTSRGDQFASLFYAVIAPDAGEVEFANAGSSTAYAVSRDGAEQLASRTELLAAEPDCDYRQARRRIARGELLVILNEGAQTRLSAQGQPSAEAKLESSLTPHLSKSATQLVGQAKAAIEAGGPNLAGRDLTLLLLKRR